MGNMVEYCTGIGPAKLTDEQKAAVKALEKSGTMPKQDQLKDALLAGGAEALADAAVAMRAALLTLREEIVGVDAAARVPIWVAQTGVMRGAYYEQS